MHAMADASGSEIAENGWQAAAFTIDEIERKRAGRPGIGARVSYDAVGPGLEKTLPPIGRLPRRHGLPGKFRRW